VSFGEEKIYFFPLRNRNFFALSTLSGGGGGHARKKKDTKKAKVSIIIIVYKLDGSLDESEKQYSGCSGTCEWRVEIRECVFLGKFIIHDCVIYSNTCSFHLKRDHSHVNY
jgi:hypothetical protein